MSDQVERAPFRSAASADRTAFAARLMGWSPGALALIALLLVLIVPPLFYLVKTSLYTSEFDGSFGDFTFEYYQNLLATPGFLAHFRNSVVFALCSGTFAIVFGAVQAWIVERTNAPFRRFVFLQAVISLGVPHVLYTIGWLLLLGKQGPLNQFLMHVTHSAQPLFNVNSMVGMILIEGMIWTPLGFLMLSAVMRSFDASFEEAAMMSGAGPLKTIGRITLPLAAPAFLALFLLICIRAFEAFDIPALVGSAGGVSVLSTDIYDSIRHELPPNFGQAGAFSVVLMALVIGLLQWQGRVLKSAERFQTITSRGFRPRVMDLGRWRFVAAALLGFLFLVLMVIPIGMLVITSLLPFYDGLRAETFARLTFENYHVVAGSPSFRQAIGNTLILGASTATIVCLLTAGSAWLAVRRFPGGALINQLATLPLVFPAIVLGVAFLQLFVNLPIAIYGTLSAIIIACVVQYLPYGMRFSYAGALQISRELEEAALMAGAGRFATFRRIVLPLMAPSVSTAWLFVMLLSVRAVGMPILLAGPNSQVVAVTIFDQWTNGQITVVAAFGLVWTALMMCIGLVFHRMAQRYGVAVR
jgi:iron(III) transport system permease protein